MTPLGEALRQKFATPQEALRALGLDANILKAGTDVVVGDSIEEITTMATAASKKRLTTVRSILCTGAVSGFLAPKLAKDAKIELGAIFDGLTKKNWAERKPLIVEAVKTATKGKLAKDASIEEIATVLDMIDAHPDAIDADPLPQKQVDDEEKDLPGFLKGKLTEDDYTAAMDMLKAGPDGAGAKAADAEETPEEKKAREEKEKDAADKAAKDKAAKDEEAKNMVTKDEMSKAVAVAVKTATDAATKTQVEIREAEKFVRPWVGELAMAHDSADAVYRTALGALGVKIEGVHSTALKPILEAQPKPGDRKSGPRQEHVAMDAKARTEFETMFPGAARIKVL